MTALPPGTRIGPYDIAAHLGSGGMGDVYRAVQRDIRRTVALKVLSPTLAYEPSFVNRLVREARTMGHALLFRRIIAVARRGGDQCARPFWHCAGRQRNRRCRYPSR